MSRPENDTIQAQQAPLSHLSSTTKKHGWRQNLDWRIGAMAGLVIAAVITAVVWQPQITNLPTPDKVANTNEVGALVNQPQTNQLPPFAQTQRQRAREQAQAALAQFVEQQIKLEDTMQVDAWGATELHEAMELAQAGDAEFVAERFEASLQAYQDAATKLNDIIELGNGLFDQRLQNGLTHIAALEPDEAVASIQSALLIKPKDTTASGALTRAEQLPTIIGKLRSAKNHELGGRFSEALAVYQEIQQLDPQTTGLSELRSAAANAQSGDDLTSFLSRGFTALQNKNFDQAKRFFNQALQLDPNNDIARGGLQQVAKDNDLAIIRRHQSLADTALAQEQWSVAIENYQAVLKLDNNIQFAINGLGTAKSHLRAQRILEKISNEPQKLSSEKLYLDAIAIVEDAKSLEQPGPILNQLITDVEQLLVVYRDPVDVVLLSDNATNVIVSNVGQLGLFERKTLTLRPGQYTIRGSQDGCRDIFLSIEVLPGIAPLDVSCPEVLK